MDAETSPKAALASPGRVSETLLEGVWGFDRFQLDLDRGEFRSGETLIALRPKTFALISHLVAHPGRLISRDELLSVVWRHVVVTEDSVTQCIGELRAAMGDRAHLIKTIPRRGYLLDATVERLPPGRQPVAPEPPVPADAAKSPPKRRRRIPWTIPAGLAIALLAGVSVIWWQTRLVHIDSAVAARRSIAILPFLDLSEPLSPAFAEAVAQDLTRAVSKLANTLVFAPSSTAGFTGQKADVRAVGRALGATHVLTGSVQRQGDAVQIRAQLQRADSAEVLWSERFEYAGTAQWNWQQDITQRIANALNDRLYADHQPRSDYVGLKPDAINATLQGIYLQRRIHTRDELLRTRALFESALAKDPNSATALTGLAFSHLNEVNMRWSTERERQTELASRAIERAIELRPDDSVAFYGRALVLYIRGQVDDAARACERALELWPNQPMCLQRLGFFRLQQGRPAEVAPLVQLAMRLNPLDAIQSSFGHFYIGMALFHLHEDDKAYEEMQEAVASNPQNGFGWQWMAAIDALHGRDELARSNLEQYEKIIPGHSIRSLRATETSKNLAFWAERDRFYVGLHKAGLPE
jgi:TolB-like protein/DNA-binding winged helix-turn-helix (wHTH) protein